MRKHFQRAAGIATLQACVLPAAYLIDAAAAGMVVVAPLAAAAAVALWRGAFAPARALSAALAVCNAAVLWSLVVHGTPDGGDSTQTAMIFWGAVFLYGSLEAAFAGLLPSVRRAASSSYAALVFARRRTVARQYFGTAGPPRSGWRHVRPSLALATLLVILAAVLIPILVSALSESRVSVSGIQNVVMLLAGALLLWVWQEEVQRRMLDAVLIVVLLGTSEGLAWEVLRVHRLGLLHNLVIVFPPVADVPRRWQTLVDRERQAGGSVLPATLVPTRTLALAFDSAGSPIAIEGPRDEWSYETALRLAAVSRHAVWPAGAPEHR